MKLVNYILFSLMFFCSAVSGQNDQFIIKGKTQQKEGLIMLYNSEKGVTQSVDTTFIESGTFSFRGKENADNFSAIVLQNSNGRQEMECILENGTIAVDFDLARATGTYLNDLYIQYQDSVKYYVKVINENLKSENETPNGVVVRIGSALDSAYYNYGYYTLNFKKKNINNVVGREMFLREINGNFGELVYSNGGGESFYEIYGLCGDDLKSNQRVVDRKKYVDKVVLEKTETKKTYRFSV